MDSTYIYIYMYIITLIKKMKENMEEQMGRSEGRKWKKEILQLKYDVNKQTKELKTSNYPYPYKKQNVHLSCNILSQWTPYSNQQELYRND